MKKLKKKLPLVLVALGLLFFGLYQYFKNYVDPGIFDNDYQYTRVYNYKAEKIKPKKAKVKEINLEFIYYEKIKHIYYSAYVPVADECATSNHQRRSQCYLSC